MKETKEILGDKKLDIVSQSRIPPGTTPEQVANALKTLKDEGWFEHAGCSETNAKSLEIMNKVCRTLSTFRPTIDRPHQGRRDRSFPLVLRSDDSRCHCILCQTRHCSTCLFAIGAWFHFQKMEITRRDSRWKLYQIDSEIPGRSVLR